MNRLLVWAFVAGALPVLAAENPPAAPPVLLSLPEANPFACKSDTPPAIVTRDFPSGVTATIPEFIAVRVNATGGIEETLFVHDPIPSLEAQERQSFQKWEFLPPKKGGVAVAGWTTIELDLKFDYSRPQITRASLVPISSQDPVPVPVAGRWDEGWLATAAPLSDLKGAEAADTLDQPVLPRKTKWYADRYKGPLAAKFWIEVSETGRVSRVVPVELKDAALLPYLEKALSRWTFTAARNQGQAVACWSVLDIAGTISYDISLARASSIKKSVGPR